MEFFPEALYVDTVADGKVKATGAFVRTFWRWQSDKIEVVNVRCRIAGVQHDDVVDTVQLCEWIAQPTEPDVKHLLVNISGNEVVIPIDYMAAMPHQIRIMLAQTDAEQQS